MSNIGTDRILGQNPGRDSALISESEIVLNEKSQSPSSHAVPNGPRSKNSENP
jgi:hypothetical protein